jgi:hypothetical protein
MRKFDVDEFKRVLARSAQQQRTHRDALRGAAVAVQLQRRENQRKVSAILEPALAKAGVDAAALEKLLTDNRNSLQAAEQMLSSEAKTLIRSGSRAPYNQERLREMALRQFGTRPLATDAGLSSLIMLTAPFLIMGYSRDNTEWSYHNLVDWQIEPLDSAAKFLVDLPRDLRPGDVTGGYSNSDRVLGFFFIWENDTGAPATLNVFSVLDLEGSCRGTAASRFLSIPDFTIARITVSLYPIKWWESEGAQFWDLYADADPLQHITVLNEDKSGGIIEDGKFERSISSNFGLSYGTGTTLTTEDFVVPAGATAIFEMQLRFEWVLASVDSPNGAVLDFADNEKSFQVRCPILVLQPK